MPSVKTLNWLLIATALLVHHCVAFNSLAQVRQLQQDRIAGLEHDDDAAEPTCNSTSCYRYYNSDTAPYFIEQWPDVEWDTGEFYSGSIPVDETDPNRTLFFVFKPAEERPVDEVVIWLNGGPGCSSLLGFFAGQFAYCKHRKAVMIR